MHRTHNSVRGRSSNSLYSFSSQTVSLGFSYAPIRNGEVSLSWSENYADYELAAKYSILRSAKPSLLELRFASAATTAAMPTWFWIKAAWIVTSRRASPSLPRGFCRFISSPTGWRLPRSLPMPLEPLRRNFRSPTADVRRLTPDAPAGTSTHFILGRNWTWYGVFLASLALYILATGRQIPRETAVSATTN